MSEEKTQIAIRLADDLLARVDQYRARVMADLPGHVFTRADAIRVLIERGLIEAGLGATAPARKNARTTRRTG